MEVSRISLCSAQPHIRFARFVKGHGLTMYPVTVAYDCRMFYITGGRGTIYVNDTPYDVSAGSLVVVKHGNRYSSSSPKDEEMTALMFNFDFTDKHSDVTPFSPVEPEEYDESMLLCPVEFSDTDAYDEVLYLKNAQHMYTYLISIYEEIKSGRYGSARIADLKFGALLIELVRTVQLSDPANEYKAESIVKYILSNLEENLSDEMLGTVLHYHPNYIRKIVTEYTGLPTHKFILECRLAKALELLIETKLTLKQICSKSGFNDFAHFTKAFKRRYGKNPSSYRVQ